MNLPVPRSRGSQIYLVMLLGVAAGLGLVLVGPWRAGLMVVGAVFVVGAVARALVPPDHVGMLRVRGRTTDIVWMAVLGVSLGVLAVLVPPPTV